MYRYHIETLFMDGTVYVFSVEKLKDIEDIFVAGVQAHGEILTVQAERGYYSGPPTAGPEGINNQ